MVMFTDKPNFTFRWVCLSTFSVFFLLIGIHFIQDWRVALVKKAQAKIWEIFFSSFQICYNQFFLLENPTHWDLKTAVCPIFVRPVLDIFAVCPKNQNYLLYKTDLGLFFSYGLRNIIKSQYSVLFMLRIIFQAVLVKIHAKKKKKKKFNNTFF